jgi:mRNA-degrading endonuclease RelE of RelBE toxin-antitoxin system
VTERFRLVPSRVFLKDLARLPRGVSPSVADALERLKLDPYSGRDTKKLSALKIGVWRLRIGDYRVRYDIEGDEIRLHTVRHRKSAYR